MEIKEPKDRIIFALDVSSIEEAQKLVKMLKPHVGMFKIGLEFINTMLAEIISAESPGDTAVAAFRARRLFRMLDGNVFWDGKFHDIPNTMAGAASAVAKLGVKMFNVHASSGVAAMKEVIAHKGGSLVLAVTVLTSLSIEDAGDIYRASPLEAVYRFVVLAKEAGVDGIICSPQELLAPASPGVMEGLIKVVPGIRPLWAAAGDQKRIMTPADAIKAGADYLVIGRPISSPPAEIGTPIDAAKKIADEIAEALKEVEK